MVKTRSQAPGNQQPVTGARRSKRKSVATPAGTCDTPDHVLSLQFDSAAATKPFGNKSKSRVSKLPSADKKSKAPSKPAPEIAILTLPCLIEIFKFCDQRERLHVLPLVCKKWAKTLRAPSAAWESLSVHTRYEDRMSPNTARMPALSYAKLLEWIKPRAKGITDINFEYNIQEDVPGEPSAVAETNFHAILKAVAPTLESFQIRSTNSGLGFTLRWNILKKIAAAAKTLTTLTLDFVDDGNITSAHVEDIKVFEKLEHLTLRWTPFLGDQRMGERSLSLMELPTTAHSDGTTSTASSLPSNLFDLQHLKTLNLNSQGINGYFHSDLHRLQHLTQLRLEHQNISGLDFSIPENIVSISLRGSNLGPSIMVNGLERYINEGMATSWREIDLAHCNLKKLKITEYDDDDEADCEQLLLAVETLDLSYNSLGPLAEIDFIGDMWNLKRLHLCSCGLSNISGRVTFFLHELQFLDLSSNNLVDFPPDFIHMKRLRELYLRNNHFPAIPEIVQRMGSLRHIDFRECNYLEIPKSITEWLVGKENLTRVDVSKSIRDGRFQDSSILWLEEAVKSLTLVGRGDVLTYKN